MHPSAIDLVSDGGRQYGVPYTYYQVGLVLPPRPPGRRRASPTLPRTCAELLAACDRLKAAGIEPIAIGTRDLWPAAAWFDYLDLRENGLAFHMALMQGRVAYTDPRVRAVFDRWRELLDRDCFSRNHASSSWQESQALIYQGKAAMMLIGNYIVGNFPADVRDRMDVLRASRRCAPEVGRFEDAPMNTVHIPRARAQQGRRAKRFLRLRDAAPTCRKRSTRRCSSIPVNTHAGGCRRPLPAQGPRAPRRRRRACRSTSTATRARTSPTSR